MIESKYLDLALSIAESSQVLMKWEQGDVVLLDVSRHCAATGFPLLIYSLELRSITLPGRVDWQSHSSCGVMGRQ